MSKGSMRSQMPVVAAWIDNLRVGFGEALIDDIIRRGIRGEPVFHAIENGHEIGTPVPTGIRVGTNERGNRYLVDGPQPGDPIEQSEGRGRRKSLNNQNWGKK